MTGNERTTGAGPGVVVGPASGSRCPHRLARMSARPGWWRDAPVDEGIRLRALATAERRTTMRDRVRESLPEGGLVDLVGDGWTDLPGPGPGDDDVASTLDALRTAGDGPVVLWGAALPADPVSGRAGMRCVLVADPEGGWVPALVVNHKVVDPRRRGGPYGVPVTRLSYWSPHVEPGLRIRRHAEDTDRLAHAWRLLETIGAVEGEPRGAVLGLGTELALVHALAPALEVSDENHRDRLAVAGGEVGTRPSRVGECRTCPWWEGWESTGGRVRGCREVLEESDDVSLVVSGAQVGALRRAGVTTVAGLAERGGGRPKGWTGESYADAVLRARAHREGVRLVPKVARPAIRRGDVEVDVDLESHLDDGVYLWGTLLTVRDGRGLPEGYVEGYRPFGTWTPLPHTDEGRAFAEFWSWLLGLRDAVRAEGRSFVAYCYSRTAENAWMLSSAARFGPEGTHTAVSGVPSVDEVRSFLAHPGWVDVHESITNQYVSTVGTGLKAVAPAAGFAWRDPGASGEASLGWYRDVVAGDSVIGDRAKRRLKAYNEDDVLATRAVREWISGAPSPEGPGALREIVD